jgi:hypothetical protein
MKLENAIQIDAPPEVVWAVTEDLERWPQWTPTMESVKRINQGQLEVGSAALIKQPGLPETKWVVTALTARERFTWETRIRGIHMIATHEITAAKNGTLSVLRVEMVGLVARLLWLLILSATVAGAGKRRSQRPMRGASRTVECPTSALTDPGASSGENLPAYDIGRLRMPSWILKFAALNSRRTRAEYALQRSAQVVHDHDVKVAA